VNSEPAPQAGPRNVRAGSGPIQEPTRLCGPLALVGTGAVVYTGDQRGPLEFPDAAKARTTLVSVADVLAGTAIGVGILVVAGTFALSVQQRYRELALLRAVAATPKQVKKMIGGDALAAGAAGSAASTALADLDARRHRPRHLPAPLRNDPAGLRVMAVPASASGADLRPGHDPARPGLTFLPHGRMPMPRLGPGGAPAEPRP
jgi:putative ABC transport system permease protein